MQDTDDLPMEELAAARLGRLVKLKFRRNMQARQAALASIRPLPNGRLQARIGGRMRGRTESFPSRVAAERAVNNHYNEVMMQFIHSRAAK